MPRFTAYDDFRVTYEAIKHGVDGCQKNLPIWTDYDRAIEVLSASINPLNSRRANRKRAMTLNDLLIKVYLAMYVNVEQIIDHFL